MPVLSFKVTPEQARDIRRGARQKRVSVSEYLRSLAMPPVATPAKRVVKKHPVSGLLYDATPGPFVTDAEIREALADFP